MNQFLTEEEQTLIAKAIGVAEENTIAEIVVCISTTRCGKEGEDDRARVEKAVRLRAIREFERLGIGSTRHSAGCIIFISPLDRYVTVRCDRLVSKRIGHDEWPKVVDFITKGAKEGKHYKGVLQAVQRMGERLAEHFPADGEGVLNELPNAVVFSDGANIVDVAKADLKRFWRGVREYFS